MKSRFPFVWILILSLIFAWATAGEARSRPMAGLGDSIGEGVQSANASVSSQGFSYLNYIAGQMAVPFPLPWIISSPVGWVGNTKYRARLFPFLPSANLAVSGADVHSILYDRADASRVKEIDSETDLVLFPRIGSQIEVLESLDPSLVVCWIGNNDLLSAAITFDRLDASQMTPVEAFSTDFGELVRRLAGTGRQVILANIPEVTHIAFLVDRWDLVYFLGDDYGLEEGSYTSIVVMLLIKLGLNDGSLIHDPDFVLDFFEIQAIQERLHAFNTIIHQKAQDYGMPVVDINRLFREMTERPPVFFGIPLIPRFLGGLFSLDGVHPSNIAHAMIANAFIETMNEAFGFAVPQIEPEDLETIFLEDPFIDKDGDGVVRGRPFTGLLETLSPFLGISGDRDDFVSGEVPIFEAEGAGERFLREYIALLGKEPEDFRSWTREDLIEAFREIFALRILTKSGKP